MKASQEDITQGKKLHKRLCDLAFGGLHYTEMLRIMLEVVMYARELGNHLDEMKYH
jgi:hypothetical protein